LEKEIRFFSPQFPVWLPKNSPAIWDFPHFGQPAVEEAFITRGGASGPVNIALNSGVSGWAGSMALYELAVFLIHQIQY
jgi:hypothetical protein